MSYNVSLGILYIMLICWILISYYRHYVLRTSYADVRWVLTVLRTPYIQYIIWSTLSLNHLLTTYAISLYGVQSSPYIAACDNAISFVPRSHSILVVAL